MSKLNTLTQPAPGVEQRPNGQPSGGDSLLVAQQATRVGAAQYVRMPDIYPNFPYQWVSWSDWLSMVDTQVNARLAATGATATHGLAYNGGAWATISYPPTAAWGQFGATVTQTVSLRAGYNIIRLAKGSPFFGGGTGCAEMDYIELT